MAINFSTDLYLVTQDVFSRPVTITPIASQPGQPAYSIRGIYDTESIDVVAPDGSIFSDQKTILDIREAEFTVPPIQLDRVSIPAHIGMPDLGEFEITDVDGNGGGELTLSLRQIVTAKP